MIQISKGTKMTDEQLSVFRKHILSVQGLPADTKFTCDDCSLRHHCRSVFDWYNTDGDCLEEK